VAAFAVLLLVLFVRPHGLFGRPSGEAVREH
jgi:branched-subunit amino acid ABC-type transport system permease component